MHRLLFIINKRAGSGHGQQAIEGLTKKAEALFSKDFRFSFHAAESHPEIEQVTGAFVSSGAPSVILAGGGGGTLGAVINGACAAAGESGLPGPERLKIAALRMGSGNVLARHLGAPEDPFKGLDALRISLRRNSMVPCCIGRYRFICEEGGVHTRFAETLAGFGLFGRAPGTLTRFHSRSRFLYPAMVRMLRIENSNTLEYVGAVVTGALRSLFKPGSLATAKITGPDGNIVETKLLAGAVLNFPVPFLPLSPDCRLQDDFMQLFLLPCRSRKDILSYLLMPGAMKKRAMKISVKVGRTITIKVAGQLREEFFLDEDTFFFKDKLEISPAGFLHFVRLLSD